MWKKYRDYDKMNKKSEMNGVRNMKRNVGILLSITSLPSKYGIGCFDQAAYDFVDWLEKSGQKYWQILPLGSTSHGGAYDSPYQAYSAFAGNPYFISLDALIKEGVLTEEECAAVPFGNDPEQVDYELMSKNRLPLLHKAYERSEIYKNEAFKKFCDEYCFIYANSKDNDIEKLYTKIEIIIKFGPVE